ncbi:MAG: GTPase HflX [Alkalispirochaetaceae bacterium]
MKKPKPYPRFGEGREERGEDFLTPEGGKTLLVVPRHPEESELTAERYGKELGRLCDTLGIGAAATEIARVDRVHPGLYIGSGKADEIAERVASEGFDVLVFDVNLTPAQQRNWDRLTGATTLDRQGVIIDIFAEHASSKESALQVELARLEYALPRLRNAWSHLSRQRGGARGTRGEGEKQLEMDRRMVEDRIAQIRRELRSLEKQRRTRRERRRSVPIPSASLLGYTNAGKSSLLNALTRAEVLVEDQLFATLDPTTRRLHLPNGTDCLLTDTVGFVRKLPHHLVDAFASTLEETLEADLLLLVVDGSDPERGEQLATTEKVLSQLGAQDKPRLVVVNKADNQLDRGQLMADISGVEPSVPVVFTSAVTGAGLEEMVGAVQNALDALFVEARFRIPLSRYDLVSRVYEHGRVLEESYLEDTVVLTAKVPPSLHAQLAEYRLREGQRYSS